MATGNNPPFKRFKMVPIDGPPTAPNPIPLTAQPSIILTKEAPATKTRTQRKRQPIVHRVKMPKAPSRKRLNDWFVDLKRMATARELVQEARVQTRIDDILNLAQGTSADDKLRMIQALSFATTKEARNVAPVIAAIAPPVAGPTPAAAKPPELAILDPALRAAVAAIPQAPIPRLIPHAPAPDAEVEDRALVPYIPPAAVALPEGEAAAPILPGIEARPFEINDLPDFSRLKVNAQKFVRALREHPAAVGVEPGTKRVVIAGRPIEGSDIGQIFNWIYPYGSGSPKEAPPTGTIDLLTYAFHTLNIPKVGMMRPKIIKDFFTFQVAAGMSQNRFNRIIGYVPRTKILLNKPFVSRIPRTESLNKFNIFKTIRV